MARQLRAVDQPELRRPGGAFQLIARSRSAPRASRRAQKSICAALGISSHFTDAQITMPIDPCAPVSRRIRSVAIGPLGSTCATPLCHCFSRREGPKPASPVNATSPVPHTTPQSRSGSGKRVVEARNQRRLALQKAGDHRFVRPRQQRPADPQAFLGQRRFQLGVRHARLDHHHLVAAVDPLDRLHAAQSPRSRPPARWAPCRHENAAGRS